MLPRATCQPAHLILKRTRPEPACPRPRSLPKPLLYSSPFLSLPSVPLWPGSGAPSPDRPTRLFRRDRPPPPKLMVTRSSEGAHIPARPPAPPPSRLGRNRGPGGRRRRPVRLGGPRPACQITGPARFGPRPAPDAEALPPGPCSRRRSLTSSTAKRTVRNGGDCWSRPCGRSVLVPGRPRGSREVPGPRQAGGARATARAAAPRTL